LRVVNGKFYAVDVEDLLNVHNEENYYE
jgi:hypothetical protein